MTNTAFLLIWKALFFNGIAYTSDKEHTFKKSHFGLDT